MHGDIRSLSPFSGPRPVCIESWRLKKDSEFVKFAKRQPAALASLNFSSANRKLVRLEVSRRLLSSVLGKEFVHEGRIDYPLVGKTGFWVIGKTEVYPSNLRDLLGEAVHETLGSYPIALDTTFVSHLDWLFWEGSSKLEENEVLDALVRRLKQRDVLVDQQQVDRMQAKEQLKEEEKAKARERQVFSEMEKEIDSLRGRIPYMGKKAAKEAEERIEHLRRIIEEAKKQKKSGVNDFSSRAQ